jgi:zinc protease
MFVVGDVDPERVFALAEEKFGSIPAQAPPDPVTTVEPEQQGERRIVLQRPAQTPMLQIAWHSGAANDPAMPALDVLMTLLTQGDASRMHQALVEEEGLAIEIGGYVHQGFDPGLTWIYAVLPPGGSVDALEARITQMLDEIIRDGVAPGELVKAKNILVSGYWRELSTISGKAQALGTYEVFHGDYRKLFGAPAAWEAVEDADVRAVAAAVFRSNNRTVGVLEPAARD